MKLYEANSSLLSSIHLTALVDILSSISHQANATIEAVSVRRNLCRACAHLDISHPPLVHFQSETSLIHLNLLSQNLSLQPQLIAAIMSIINIYLSCASARHCPAGGAIANWVVPLGTARKEELAARTPLLIAAVRAMTRLEKGAFRRYIPSLFPSLIELVRSEHSSVEIQFVLCEIFESFIGPIVLSY